MTYLADNSAAKSVQTEKYFAELQPGHFIEKNMLHTVETSTEYLTRVCGMFQHKCPGYSFANHVFILDTFCFTK